MLLEDPRFSDWVELWLKRKIDKTLANEFDGVYGHFRLFSSADRTEKAWTQGFDPGGYGFHCGQTVGHHLTPLIGLLNLYPRHRNANAWRQALENFAYGWFLPASMRNPFGLYPLGWFAGEGLLHFAGLWHGCNGLYGRIAAQAMDFAEFFGDPNFA